MSIKQTFFSVEHTEMIKGIAIIFMLWHHLFLRHPEYPIAQEIAIFSKICVAMFLFLSGYGLYETVKYNTFKLRDFYLKRISKIYLNFWFVFIIFVPIGILFFNHTLENVFKDDIYSKLFINFFGMQMVVFKWMGYGLNPTWWFLTLIISLYILFPLLKYLLDKFGIFFFVLLVLSSEYVKFLSFIAFLNWAPAFVFGMLISKYNILNKLLEINFSRYKTVLYLLVIFLLGFLLIYIRSILIDSSHHIDWLISFILILFFLLLIPINSIGMKFLIFLGIHSFNIFLFHTFFFKYFIPDITYSFGHPFLIFLFLLLSSLITSIILEKIKSTYYVQKIFLIPKTILTAKGV